MQGAWRSGQTRARDVLERRSREGHGENERGGMTVFFLSWGRGRTSMADRGVVVPS